MRKQIQRGNMRAWLRIKFERRMNLWGKILFRDQKNGRLAIRGIIVWIVPVEIGVYW